MPDLLPGNNLVLKPLDPWILCFSCEGGVGLPLKSVAGISSESDFGSLQQGPEPFQLIVRKGVHRVEDHCPNAWLVTFAGEFLENVVDDREEKALGLTRAGAGYHDVVLLLKRLFDGVNLMSVQLPVWVESPQRKHPFVEQTPIDEIPDRRILGIRWRRFQERSLGKEIPALEDGS